jgi:hypothetical protein
MWRAVKEIPAKELAEAAGISERAIKAIRNGHAMPHARTHVALKRAVIGLVRKGD